MGLSKPNIKELRKRFDVEGLIKALKYSDWKVRRDATLTLGKIADKKAVALSLKKAVKPLIRALKDENAEVRRAAASVLGSFTIYGIIDRWKIIDEKAIEPLEKALKEALKDEDKNVAWNAASTLAGIPIPLTLERGERMVRRIERVDLEAAASSGLLLLTNRRLIFNAYKLDGSISYRMSLADILSCEVKKSMFGKKKLVVVSRQTVLKQRLQLVTGVGPGATTRYSWKEVGTRVLREPKPAVFTGIKQPETLKSEITEQVEIYKKALSQKKKK